MGRLLGRLALVVPVVDIAVAGSNDQVEGVHSLRAEGEVKRVVAEIVTLEHLLLQWLLIDLYTIHLVVVLAPANLDLRPIRDAFGQNWKLANFVLVLREKPWQALTLSDQFEDTLPVPGSETTGDRWAYLHSWERACRSRRPSRATGPHKS